MYTQAQVRLNRTSITDRGIVRRSIMGWFPQGLYWSAKDKAAAKAEAARKDAGPRPRLQIQ